MVLTMAEYKITNPSVIRNLLADAKFRQENVENNFATQLFPVAWGPQKKTYFENGIKPSFPL